MKRIPSISRRRSRGSEARFMATMGSSAGEALFSRSSPWE